MEQNPYGLVALWTQGDVLIKTVAVLLLAMSVVSWYVIVTRAARALRMRRAARMVAGFWHTHSFVEGMALLDGQGRDNPFRLLALEGQAAVDHHRSNKDDLHGQLNLAEWLTESLRGAIDDAQERMGNGLAVLASVGSTAPFVGLFGTVWGIYHALVGIGVSGQASIDKVAGPVGEALIMTAFGLAVAIPAVLGYNALTRSNKGVVNKLNRFARQLHAYFLTGSPVVKEAGKVLPIRQAKQGA
ncbi:MAG: MotA/TolQ/ExbB proton channel family protein [Pseudomonadota bacterium]